SIHDYLYIGYNRFPKRCRTYIWKPLVECRRVIIESWNVAIRQMACNITFLSCRWFIHIYTQCYLWDTSLYCRKVYGRSSTSSYHEKGDHHRIRCTGYVEAAFKEIGAGWLSICISLYAAWRKCSIINDIGTGERKKCSCVSIVWYDGDIITDCNTQSG